MRVGGGGSWRTVPITRVRATGQTLPELNLTLTWIRAGQVSSGSVQVNFAVPDGDPCQVRDRAGGNQ